MNSFEHITVLLNETVHAVLNDTNGIYVDATFGRGGHSRKLLAQLDAKAKLLVIDKDPVAIAAARSLADSDARVVVSHASFAAIHSVVESFGWQGSISGILADFGVSSPQIDDAERGFSFQHDGPLDMRMDSSQGINAAEWLTQVSESELADALFLYGEERHSRRIAKAIKAELALRPITRTKVLADIVAEAHPAWERHKHPATRSFQAIRIAVNNELQDIQVFLKDALAVLKPEGRLAVISFHSLEDRLVKQFFQKEAKGDDFPPNFPVTVDMLNPRLKLVGKSIEPSAEEVAANPRSRSAHLRVAQKIVRLP